ncbi:MAG: hypothetical protein HKN19_13135 [Halioglobus sp.]|nr:hypothetical protein [Halioglobus sp.]
MALVKRRPLPSEESISALAGYRFPGGDYTIAHWENFLLTECTGAQLMPQGMAHPVALFHAPITGAGTSIAAMFELGQAESDLSIMIESYDWEMFLPLYEETRYNVSGSIRSAQRLTNDEGKLYDRIQFCFELRDPDNTLAARTTITWHYTRDTL